jgi:hypothetical protein
MEATKVTVIAVILTSQEDWQDWIELIKTTAETKGVWKYVDPAGATSRPNMEVAIAPVLPIRPTPNDIKPSTTATPTLHSQLDTDQLEELRNRQFDFDRQLKTYDREVTALGDLRALIQRTVARDNLIYTFDCDTIRQILVNLKRRFSPTAEYKERVILQKWNDLKKGLQRGMEIEFWLTRWEKAYGDGIRVNLPDVTGTRPVRDFLAAISPTSSGFADYWQNRLMDEGQGSMVPDLYGLIQKYREYRADNPEQRHTATHGAFGPTLNGMTPDGKRSPCLCGDDHRFSKCPYLIPQERLHGWKADTIKEQKVQEALRSEKLRDLVEDLRRYAIEYEKKRPAPTRPNNL